jgi:hypothetical protein
MTFVEQLKSERRRLIRTKCECLRVMKNYNYLISMPAVPSRHRDQAESAKGKINTVREAVSNGEEAVWACHGGAYGYFLEGTDEVIIEPGNMHPAYVLMLLASEDPGKDLTVEEAFKELGWDYASEKAAWAAEHADLDAVRVGWLNTSEILIEEEEVE